MINKQRSLLICCLLGMLLPWWAQPASGQKRTYPVSTDGNKYVVSGFIPYNDTNDGMIFANALLWTIENVCPQFREGITEVNVSQKNFNCKLVFSSAAGSGLKNTYYCNAIFRVTDGKLIYYLSDISIESSAVVMKKVMPIEKLEPEKKSSHKETMDDFVEMESQILNKMFDFVASNKPKPVTHWDEISNGKATKGMTEDECRMAFGKPQTVSESNGETQWMYSSSFYLFFRNGRVETIIQ